MNTPPIGLDKPLNPHMPVFLKQYSIFHKQYVDSSSLIVTDQSAAPAMTDDS